MLNRYKITILFALLAGCWLSSATAKPGQQIQRDTMFVSIHKKRGKIVYHTVRTLETIYSISRYYNVGLEQIIERNPKTRNRAIQLLDQLEIPIQNNQIIYNLPAGLSSKEYVKVFYRVKMKDNLFQISRVMFKLPTEWLIRRNNLPSDQLRTGQVLHVGWIKKDTTPLLVTEGTELNEENKSVDPYGHLVQFEESISLSKVIKKNQVALWKHEMQGSSGFLIMHRTIPEKTIVEIRNPMSGVIAYGRVIGQIPENLYPEEVDMIVSADLARELKVLDARFFVQIRYADGRLSAH